MDQNKIVIRPVTIAATLLGITESVIWIFLSTLAILCHYQIIPVDSNSSYGTQIYQIFLTSGSTQNIYFPSNMCLIVTSEVFLIFLWFYLSLSLVWFVFSIFLLWAMVRDKFTNAEYFFGGWAATATATSILDLILTGLIAYDLAILEDRIKADFLAYEIVMSIACRGYVLWFINVIFVGILAKFAFNLIKNKKNNRLLPIIDGYNTSSVNPPWFHLGKESPWIFSEVELKQNGGFERSQSFSSEISPETKRIDGNSQKFSTFNSKLKVASIGRKKKCIPPFIPKPDYTPPESPIAPRVHKNEQISLTLPKIHTMVRK